MTDRTTAKRFVLTISVSDKVSSGQEASHIANALRRAANEISGRQTTSGDVVDVYGNRIGGYRTEPAR